MSHFSEEYLSFFAELGRNNEKSWFDENRKRYETYVKKPFYTFLETVIEKINRFDPEIDISPKEAVFRINRDIRFAKDKTPYKTHMSAVISSTGRRKLETPGLYLQLSANDVHIGGGSHSPSKDDLYNIRKFLIDNYENFEKLHQSKEFKKCFGELQGDKNKVLPAIFKEEAKTKPLLYNKQFYYMRKYEDSGIILNDDFDDFVLEHYIRGKEFNDFINIARRTK